MSSVRRGRLRPSGPALCRGVAHLVMGPLSWPLPSGRSIPDSPPPRLCSRHLPGRRTASCASDWLSGLPLLPLPLVCPPAPSSPGAHVGRGGANLCVPHVCHICERLSSIHMRDTVSIVPFEVGRSPAGDPARGGRPASAPPMWYTTERAPTLSRPHCCASCLAPHGSCMSWAFHARRHTASRPPPPAARIAQRARLVTPERNAQGGRGRERNGRRGLW